MTGLLLLAGLAALVAGVAQIYVPAAFIAGGVIAIVSAFAFDAGGDAP